MERIAKFHKVSFEEYRKDWTKVFGETEEKRIKAIYEGIELPQRATKGSAGYDFYMPITMEVRPGETVMIPTGICAEMESSYVLLCFPRSGLGFKFRLQLNNTVGVIDSDYFGTENEGHIFARMTNDSNEGKTVRLEAHTGFMQGVFVPFGITVDDDATQIRTGGLGSTTKNK